MRRHLLVLALAVCCVLIPVANAARPAQAATTFSFALIGDLPYTTADAANFPPLAADINNDIDVSFVAHTGDTKGGDLACTDATMQGRFDMFETFEDAFWFTPGDNDWSDCGFPTPAFDPDERLAFLRNLFYPTPGMTTGSSPRSVDFQSGYVENTKFTQDCVTFGAIHVLWRAPLSGTYTPDELAKIAARNAANVAWVDSVFDTAEAQSSEAVLLLMQADPTNPPVLSDKIIERASDFGKQVVIAHGDGHNALVTPNFLGESNIVRWQVIGGRSNANKNVVGQWAKVDVDCSATEPISQGDVLVGTTPTTTTTTTTTSTTAPPTTTSPTTTSPSTVTSTPAADTPAVITGIYEPVTATKQAVRLD